MEPCIPGFQCLERHAWWRYKSNWTRRVSEAPETNCVRRLSFLTFPSSCLGFLTSDHSWQFSIASLKWLSSEMAMTICFQLEMSYARVWVMVITLRSPPLVNYFSTRWWLVTKKIDNTYRLMSSALALPTSVLLTTTIPQQQKLNKADCCITHSVDCRFTSQYPCAVTVNPHLWFAVIFMWTNKQLLYIYQIIYRTHLYRYNSVSQRSSWWIKRDTNDEMERCYN